MTMRTHQIVVVLLALSACNKGKKVAIQSGPQTVTVTMTGGQNDIVSIPPGVSCSGSTCTGTFEGGARITLRGQADFPLVDFEGPCEQKFVHTCTFVVTGPITVAATIHQPEGN